MNIQAIHNEAVQQSQMNTNRLLREADKAIDEAIVLIKAKLPACAYVALMEYVDMRDRMVAKAVVQ